MRDYEIVRRRRARVLTIIALAAVGVLVAFASSVAAAAPRPIGIPVRHWSVSKIEQGVGKVAVDPRTAQSEVIDPRPGTAP